jgi:hypothetical protein
MHGARYAWKLKAQLPNQMGFTNIVGNKNILPKLGQKDAERQH